MFLALLAFAVGTVAFAQGGARLQASFGFASFYNAQADMPYVETYLQFDAWTLTFVPQDDGVLRATVEVSLIARKGDSVCYYKKYDLHSPTVAPDDELDFSFLDVQRFALACGIYDLDITLRDKALDAPAVAVNEKLYVDYDSRRPALSSVQTMADARPTVAENILSRGGYDLEPYVSDFYPKQVDRLNFYYEVYNINKEIPRQPFLAMATIERRETALPVDGMRVVARKQSDAVVPVYGSIDISQLPSGNYNLMVELRNADGQTMLYSRVPFFRSNPDVKDDAVSDFSTTFVGGYRDDDSLNLYLDALTYLASSLEREVIPDLIATTGNIEEKQAFLHRFWTERDPMMAETLWLRYKERIDYVQAHFSYPKTPGIHTDRGRVYLVYGPPDFVRDEKNFVGARRAGQTGGATGGENGATLDVRDISKTKGYTYYLPYQLWRYNKLPNDNPDRVFLFWDEHRSGFYRLLNSNARGEIQEPGWERRLSRGTLDEGDTGEVGEQFNRGY